MFPGFSLSLGEDHGLLCVRLGSNLIGLLTTFGAIAFRKLGTLSPHSLEDIACVHFWQGKTLDANFLDVHTERVGGLGSGGVFDSTFDFVELHIVGIDRDKLIEIVSSKDGILGTADETVEFVLCIFGTAHRFEELQWLGNLPDDKGQDNDVALVLGQSF